MYVALKLIHSFVKQFVMITSYINAHTGLKALPEGTSTHFDTPPCILWREYLFLNSCLYLHSLCDKYNADGVTFISDVQLMLF